MPHPLELLEHRRLAQTVPKGARLVYRTKRRVSLTQADEIFLSEARRIVAQMDAAALRARQIDRGEDGELCVGVTAPALYIVLPEIVARFSEKAPRVRLERYPITCDRISLRCY